MNYDSIPKTPTSGNTIRHQEHSKYIETNKNVELTSSVEWPYANGYFNFIGCHVVRIAPSNCDDSMDLFSLEPLPDQSRLKIGFEEGVILVCFGIFLVVL